MILYVMIAIGLLMRILPHEANIAPIAAIALFSGAYLNKRIGPWIPLVIMVISDLIIGLHNVVFYTWGSFVLIGFIGVALKSRRTPLNILGAAIFSSVLFFLLTNFGVWVSWYPHTAQGFFNCYVRALPFFRNSLVSNLVFSFAFFGIYEFTQNRIRNENLRRVLVDL